MTDHPTEPQQLVGEYATAVAEYRAAKRVGARRLVAVNETAFFAAELAPDNTDPVVSRDVSPPARRGATSDGARVTDDWDSAAGPWLLIAAGVIEAAILITVLAT